MELVRLITLLLLASVSHSDAEDEAKKALNAARRFAEAGEFERALERHVWFHEHALEVDEAYYGVRLSFALADWVELAEEYPPALKKLKSIRDEKTARLVAGANERALFHDVESINEQLGKADATVALFKKLDDECPEFAGEVFDLTTHALTEAGEFKLARKYLRDPVEEFTVAKNEFEEGMRWATANAGYDASQRAFETIFANDIVVLITILAATGDGALAREIQDEALKVVASPAIRDALTM